MDKEETLLDKKVPFTLKNTRKAFWVEYICVFIIFSIWFFSKIKIIILMSTIESVLLGLVLVIILLIELSRATLRYEIGVEKLEIIKGIIKQDKKNIYYHPLGFVPDINVKQSRIQRILGYGTISVTVSGQNSFEISDVDKPEEVMAVIERQIKLSKHPEKKKE
ncbi:hypothetical protein COY27_05965 [Candidatus Woesearchaeota archaeon CG_4_10_14_0_2_um_filter_33_13]|nr:MAG: hypothetical protein COY27_05965 [Candidatus Woesearchaeota archaeon CG_4_10_14_0_2_um_filter_33_13]